MWIVIAAQKTPKTVSKLLAWAGYFKKNQGRTDISLPLDILKGGRNKVAKSKVESPVRGRAERDGLATETKREQLRWVDPRHRTERDGVRSDEEVGAGNDGLGGRARDLPGLGLDTVDAAGDVVAVGSEDTGVGEEPGHHKSAANEEGRTAAPAIDPDQSGNGHGDVDNVLNG